MRHVRELIQELEAEAGRFTRVGIAVGFDDSTKFVWSGELDNLQTLKRLVEYGGEPVALVGFVVAGREATLYCRPLAEYKDEQWVQDYLDGLIVQISSAVVAEYGAKIVNKAGANAWLN